MIRRPPISTRTDTLFPYTTLFRSAMQVHPLIETNAALVAFCDLIGNSDFIAVDTEFMPENTFWPELLLTQAADREHAAAIVPMAPGIGLQPMPDLPCGHEAMLKVFQARGKDFENNHHPHGN